MSSKLIKSDQQQSPSCCSTSVERKLTCGVNATSIGIVLVKLQEFSTSMIRKMVLKITSFLDDISKKIDMIMLKSSLIFQAIEVDNLVKNTFQKLLSIYERLHLDLDIKLDELDTNVHKFKDCLCSAFENELSTSAISKIPTLAMNKDKLIRSSFCKFSDYVADIFGRGREMYVKILTEADVCGSRILSGMTFADTEVPDSIFVENSKFSDCDDKLPSLTASDFVLQTDFSKNQIKQLKEFIALKLDTIINHLPLIIACYFIQIYASFIILDEFLSSVLNTQNI